MGFTLPLALVGLLAAALPVAVHLIRRRDLPLIPLPTLALLERARVASRRRMHVVDLLLLACRVVVMAILAMAVAGPFVRSQLPWGDGRLTSVAIVLDDSMSMGRRDGGASPLARARSRADEIVSSLPAGSEVTVILAGSPPRVLLPLTDDHALARQRLDTLSEGGARGTALADAVDRAVRELDGSRHDSRRMVVLSDFARHAMGQGPTWPGHVESSVERMGSDVRSPNRTVESAVAVPDPTQPGRASVRITVRGFDTPDESITLALRHADGEIARQRVEMTGGVGRAVLHAPLPDTGDPTAHVEVIDDDALPIDDVRGVLLRSPNAIRVLVVNGDPHPSRLEDEVAFLTKAFDVAPGDAGSISYRVVDADTLDVRALARTDVVVLANVPAPSPAVGRALTEFVQEGGGLLVAPGHRAEPRSYAARLGSVLPARPSATAGEVQGAGLTADSPGDLVPDGPLGLEGVVTRRRWVLETSGKGHEVLLRFADGAPALAWGRFGDGHAAVLATTVDDDWTDLPYRPGFVPLAFGLVRRLTPMARLPERPFPAGTVVPIPVGAGVLHLRVVGPDGSHHDYRGPDLEDGVQHSHTHLPGAYRVRVRTRESQLRDDPRAAFLVAPPLAESDLTPDEVPVPPEWQGTERAPAEPATIRRPIAPWFFLVAGLLVALEAILRRPRPLSSGRRSRGQGDAPA
jgi:hypothetical protein